MSEHPIGKAIVDSCKAKGYTVPAADSARIIPGRGIEASVGGKELAVGNAAMMSEKGIVLSGRFTSTSVHVVWGGEFIGSLVLSDSVRGESYAAISALKEMSIVPILATGDSEAVAKGVGANLGIEEIHAGCLPEDKLGIIRSRENTCMVGDGVNDSPSLKAADVGISMGGIGSDIAIDASDIVTVNDGIGGIPDLISLSRAMMSKIRLNIIVAMCINVVAVSLAVAGMLTPFAGALVHNAGSVFVVVNSALLLGWRWGRSKKERAIPFRRSDVPADVTSA